MACGGAIGGCSSSAGGCICGLWHALGGCFGALWAALFTFASHCCQACGGVLLSCPCCGHCLGQCWLSAGSLFGGLCASSAKLVSDMWMLFGRFVGGLFAIFANFCSRCCGTCGACLGRVCPC